jgi:uncharacterized protein
LTEERETLIRYRLERARETLAEADVLAKTGHWNGCVNRLYYACFYAVTALLFRNGLTSSRHSAALSLFNREFVKTGLVGRDLGEMYNSLYQARHRGDYDDLVHYDEARVRPWLSGAEQFLDEIESLVSPPGHQPTP